MKRILTFVTITASLILSTSTIAEISGVAGRTGIGGRSAVFDDAFVAIADDASAIYWNPAGLANLRSYYSSTLSHNSLFSGLFGLTGIQHDFVSLAHRRRSWGIGASVDRVGTSRIIEADKVGRVLSTEGNYSELRTSFAASMKAGGILSIGLTGNYFRIESVTSSDYVGIDAGALSRELILLSSSHSKTQLRLRLGLALRNMYHSLDELLPQYAAAAALQLHAQQGLLSDIGRPVIALAYANRIAPDRTPKLAMGVELGPEAPNWGFVNRVKLYFGVESYPSTSDTFNWKMGFRIGGGGWWFDYTREQARFLGNSNRATIDLEFGAKVIRNVALRSAEDGQEVRSHAKFETTDEIVATIRLSNHISLAEVRHIGIQLVLVDPVGEVIDKVDFNEDEMDLTDEHEPRYIFQPVRDWFAKRNAIQPGKYTIEIVVNDESHGTKQFELNYDSDVQKIVGEASQLLETGKLKEAEAKLLDAVQRDPSYPDTYYVAGLISELSDDFSGAQKCYREAQRFGLQEITDFQYLQPLIEQQTVENRRGIQLYERLKQLPFSAIRPTQQF